MREEQGMGEESEGTVGLGLWVWRGVVGVGSLPFGKLRTGFGRLRTGFARLRAGSLRTGEGTKGGLRGRRAGLRRRPVPFDRGRKTGASGTPAVGRTRGVGRLLGRPWVRSGPGPVARKTGGSETPPLQKRRGRGVVGETLRRRDTWADCGEWLRVDSRHEDTGWPNRRTLRLQGYDYSQAGAYAVTICTHDGAFLFGYVADGAMHLSAAGRVVERVWDGLPEHYQHVGLDAFVVMPDHVHGVIVLADVPLPGDEGWEGNQGRQAEVDASIGRWAGRGPAPTKDVGARPEDGRVGDAAPTKRRASRRHGLSEVVRGFKSMSGRRVNALRGTPGDAVWQRGYYEHVVRNQEDLNRIREYVVGNPLRWWLRREDQEGGLGVGDSG